MPSRQAEAQGAAFATPSAPVLECRRIVASKLGAPPLRPGVVDRPALLDALMSATDAPVVLVSAPAGYGKTMLLALWNERDERPFAAISASGCLSAASSRSRRGRRHLLLARARETAKAG
jgi:ATP/maltotriose-dependent transcriptional regulator MalT